MNSYFNPLLKIGLLVVLFRSISIFIYYFDSDIVATPAHLVPMALFTHLSAIFGFMFLLSIAPQEKSSKPIVGIIAIVVFSLFTLLGEIHFNLERLSGQPLHWNIFTTYLGTGFVGNMDVIGPLLDSIGLLSISVFFFIFTIYYSIKKFVEYIDHPVPYRSSTFFVGGVVTLLVALCVYGPGSRHHAIFVVQPPEWNLIGDLFADELSYSEEEEYGLIAELRQLIGESNRTNWYANSHPIMRVSQEGGPSILGEKPDIFLLVVESLRGEELQLIQEKDGILNPYKNLTRLADRGVYFKNYNSNGFPTVSGIFSMHTSTIPHLYQNNITAAQGVAFDAMAHRIKKQGYYSVALWGGNPSHVNELKWTRRWFDDFDFIVPGDYLRQSLNRSDAEVYAKLIESVNKHDESGSDKPFFGYIFTGMTHKPYKVEDAYFSSEAQRQESLNYVDKAATIEERYRSALTVLDLQVGKLLDLIDSRNKKDNTLVFLVGDHSMNTQTALSPEVAGFPVDDLVWTGAIVAGPKNILGTDIPRVETFAASHSDLLPTIIDVFNDSMPYSAFGTSLLRRIPDEERSSISVGYKGIRVDQGVSTLFLSNKYDDNYWSMPRERKDGRQLMDRTLKAGYTREQVDKIRRSLNYWSGLVEQNRVWKDVSVTE